MTVAVFLKRVGVPTVRSRAPVLRAPLPRSPDSGSHTVSSSDGQHIHLGDGGEVAGGVNGRYGTNPIIKLYTAISGRYAPFHTRIIAATARGESRNSLVRAVNLHRLGRFRDRSQENLSIRASALNLVVTAIIHWNTIYTGRAVDVLRDAGQIIPEHLLGACEPDRRIPLGGQASHRRKRLPRHPVRPLIFLPYICAPLMSGPLCRLRCAHADPRFRNLARDVLKT